MPMKSKWILTLGILAMSPSLASAKNPFSLPGLTKPASSASASETNANQEVANQIATALRQARLTGYDINIEYKDGTATLTGMIQDAQQKAAAEKLTRSVAAVKNVDNKLGLITPEAGQAVQQTSFEAPMQKAGGIEQAGYQAGATPPIASPIQQVAGQQSQSAKEKNQQTANNIAKALKASGLSGYDIEVSYKNGVADLQGVVGSQEQVQRIHQVTAQVPGVQSVNNQLQIAGMPVSQAAFQPPMDPNAPMPPGPGFAPPGPEYGMPPGMGGYPPPGMGGPVPMPAPPVMGHSGPGPVNPVYNQPYLPEHAWPTYAAYPNYGAVTYPSQYSASAFPYIGPFYPYPQVPLGWRSSTLEWDDGQWQLTFSPKTDRWWWFMNPKNWD